MDSTSKTGWENIFNFCRSTCVEKKLLNTNYGVLPFDTLLHVFSLVLGKRYPECDIIMLSYYLICQHENSQTSAEGNLLKPIIIIFFYE